MSFKNSLRWLLVFLHIDLTKNIEYDRLTKKLIRKSLKPDSNCMDIGCHHGEILDLFLKYAPNGHHLVFEPIPWMFNNLKVKYIDRGG